MMIEGGRAACGASDGERPHSFPRAAARVGQRRGGAGLFRRRARASARAAIRSRLVRRAGQVEACRGDLGHAAVRAAAGRPAAAGGDDDAAADPLMKRLMADPATVVTRGARPRQCRAIWRRRSSTRDRRALRGTRLGRQELDGELIEDRAGCAVDARDWIDARRVTRRPTLQRIVVAVDPPATAARDVGCLRHRRGRRGADGRGRCWRTRRVQGARAAGWARAAIALYPAEADCIVAEVNQGGDMVRAVIAQVDADVPVTRGAGEARQMAAGRAGGGALRARAGEAVGRVSGARGRDVRFRRRRAVRRAARRTGSMRWSGR